MSIGSLFYRLAYRSGRPRWDSTEPRPELVELAQGRLPGRALDLGCGTGTDSIYLASQGWEATGVDFAPQAIAMARSRAAASGSSASFAAGDVTRLREAGVRGDFDLVVDIGCYHGIPAGRRDAYVAEVAAVTAPGADLYLAGVSNPPAAWRLLGARGINADDLRRRFGAYFDPPPGRRAESRADRPGRQLRALPPAPAGCDDSGVSWRCEHAGNRGGNPGPFGPKKSTARCGADGQGGTRVCLHQGQPVTHLHDRGGRVG